MLRVTNLVGFDWLNSANAASATATATSTATGPGSGIAVTSVGSNTGTSSVSTITFTVPAGGIPANSVIIVGVGAADKKSLVSGSDTKGNTYQLGQTKIQSTTVMGGTLYSQNATALVSGDVITATFSAGMPNRVIVVGYATGLTTGSLIDQQSNAGGSSTTPSSGTTLTTSTAAELAVGLVAFLESATLTEASGYTQIAGASVGSAAEVHLAYKILSSTGTQVYAPSLSASKDWACIIDTLKT